MQCIILAVTEMQMVYRVNVLAGVTNPDELENNAVDAFPSLLCTPRAVDYGHSTRTFWCSTSLGFDIQPIRSFEQISVIQYIYKYNSRDLIHWHEDIKLGNILLTSQEDN